jgi:hypothetical protein
MKHPLSRFASSHLSCGRGTHPVAWQSQFYGCTGLRAHFAGH